MKLFERDPFSLMTFHRVLIGAAVLMCIFYGAWEIARNYAADPGAVIVRSAIAWLIAIGLVVYLWRIRRKK